MTGHVLGFAWSPLMAAVVTAKHEGRLLLLLLLCQEKNNCPRLEEGRGAFSY